MTIKHVKVVALGGLYSRNNDGTLSVDQQVKQDTEGIDGAKIAATLDFRSAVYNDIPPSTNLSAGKVIEKYVSEVEMIGKFLYSQEKDVEPFF